MPTVSVRVPSEIKERMERHDEINWSAVLRKVIEAELDEIESHNLAHAVATSERLSQDIDEREVAEQNSAEIIREWRERRYGGPD
jgi:predicted DNA-binding protein